MHGDDKGLLTVHFLKTSLSKKKQHRYQKVLLLYQEKLHKFSHNLLGIYNERFILNLKVRNIVSIIIVKVLCGSAAYKCMALLYFGVHRHVKIILRKGKK